MLGRALFAWVLVLLIAVQVVREAIVRTFAEARPDVAARAWPSHPDVQLSHGMIAIATAAREGKAVPPGVFDEIYGASRSAPLAGDPFLVRGVQAQLSGDSALAERAFLQAQWRDGRSLPARYFLADHYLRQRDAAKGLREVAVLARLVPEGIPKLAPYVARYAADPANVRQLRALFQFEPALEDTTLGVLASDSRNAQLILSLSSPARRSSKSTWFPALLDSLVRDRQYARARDLWARLSGVQLNVRELVYDPHFTRRNEPPPFNWTLTASTVGLAERQAGGGLHVIYYGQEDGPLASQLLMLPAGTYRLRAPATGGPAESLRWSLFCAATNAPISSIPFPRAAGDGWRFAVPASCPAQRLELGGVQSEVSRQVDLTVQGVSLMREAANG